MKFLCKYIEQKASDAGLDTLDRSLRNMRSMLEAAAKELRLGSVSHRSKQLKWQTFVARLQTKISRERASITKYNKIVRIFMNAFFQHNSSHNRKPIVRTFMPSYFAVLALPVVLV
jgi:hypothetical protein